MFPEHLAASAKILKTSVGRKISNKLWSVSIAVLPLVFIAASISLVFLYHDVLSMSVAATKLSLYGYANIDSNLVLARAGPNDIWYSSRLMILYIGIFVTAEAAFIMMAIREYLQDLVGLTEMDLIKGPCKGYPRLASGRRLIVTS